MSHAQPGQGDPADPSMEDILASIRRILNEGEPASAPPAHPDQTVVARGPSKTDGDVADTPAPEDDEPFLLDHSMMIEEPAPMEHEEIRVEHVPEAPVQKPEVSPADEALATERAAHEPLLAPTAAAAAAASIGALVRVVGQRQTPVYRGGGVTIEDIVRDELRPIVKEWLDENLAPMVERMVRAEIDRVTRAG
jgi:cell pole-organizing protein PopZ